MLTEQVCSPVHDYLMSMATSQQDHKTFQTSQSEIYFVFHFLTIFQISACSQWVRTFTFRPRACIRITALCRLPGGITPKCRTLHWILYYGVILAYQYDVQRITPLVWRFFMIFLCFLRVSLFSAPLLRHGCYAALAFWHGRLNFFIFFFPIPVKIRRESWILG